MLRQVVRRGARNGKSGDDRPDDGDDPDRDHDGNHPGNQPFDRLLHGSHQTGFFIPLCGDRRGVDEPAGRRRERFIAGSEWPIVRADPSSRPRPAHTDFLPPGARIAQRALFGSDYEDGQRVHSSAPSSACGRPDRPSGFSRPPVRVLRCPEHVPSPSRTLRKAAGTSNFSRSRPVLGPPRTSCRFDV